MAFWNRELSRELKKIKKEARARRTGEVVAESKGISKAERARAKTEEKLAGLTAKERARRERIERKRYEVGAGLTPGAKKTLKILVILLVVALVTIWVLNGIIQGFGSGVIQSWFTRGKVAIGEVEPITTFYGQVKYFIQNPFDAMDRWFNPMRTAKVVDKEEEKGIKITSFYSRGSVSENEPLIAIGEAKVFGLEDQDTVVGFSCVDQDGKKGKTTVSGIRGNVVTLYEDSGENFFGITCEFSGVKIEEVDKSLEEVTLVGEYANFLTTGSLEICTMSEKKLDSLRGKNSFEAWDKDYKRQIPNLQSNMKMRSLSSSGPIIVTLEMTSPLPYSEVGDYLVKLNFKENVGYDGKLGKIEGVKLFFSNNLEFVSQKSDFGGDFKLEENILKTINEKLSGLEESDIIDLEPIILYLKVKSVEDRIDCSGLITAKVVYDYVVDKTTTVEVVKRAYEG